MAKNLLVNVGDVGLIHGSGRSPGERNGNPLQYFFFPTPVFLPGKSHGQRSLAGYIVHGVTKSQILLIAPK